jgi:hypothetical protein
LITARLIFSAVVLLSIVQGGREGFPAATKVSGHAADSTGSLDLTRFERYQGKIQFGLEF